MTTIGPSPDKTPRDFASIVSRLRELATSAFPDWTDTASLDRVENVLLGGMGHLGDLLGYYQGANAREASWPTATQRASLVGLAKLLGYSPRGRSAAKVRLDVTLAPSPVGSFTLPVATIGRTSSTPQISFQLLTEASLPAASGVTQLSLELENSETVTERFPASSRASQVVALTRSGYIDGTITVSDLVGDFTIVQNFLLSTASDRHCIVSIDEQERPTVKFGDGIRGSMASGTITFVYRVGGGPNGNVDPNTVKTIVGSFQDSFGNAITVTCNNPARAEGGRSRAGIEEIRVAAPASLATQDRSVSRPDFETHAREVPGVARALYLTSNEDTSIGENEGHVYIVPDGGGTPSQSIIDAVLHKLQVEKPCHPTHRLYVFGALYKTIDIRAVIYRRSGVSTTVASAAVRTALRLFFALTRAPDAARHEYGTDPLPNERIDFGLNYASATGAPTSQLPYSDLYNVVRDVPEVRKMGDQPTDFLVAGRHADASIELREFPVLGTVTLVDGDSGAVI